MENAAASPSVKAALGEILDAAATCFMQNGYERSSLDDVARQMGATKGRIYHYFASKSALLNAVRQRAMDINFAALQQAYSTPLPPGPRFFNMAKAHALSRMKQHIYQRVLLESLHQQHDQADKADKTGGGSMSPIQKQRHAYEDMFRDVLCTGLGDGTFRFKTISFALHATLTMLSSTVFWYSPRPGETAADRDEIADELAEMTLLALGGQRNF